MNFLPLIVAGAGIVLASLVGLVFKIGTFARFTQTRGSLLTSLAAGTFLISALLLMRESIEIIGTLKGVLTIAGGFILFMIIQKTLPESHHHHDTEHCEHGHDRRGAMKVLLGDMLHNIGDGIILVPAFFVSTELGFITAGSIFIHEIVQEISEFIILRQGGYSLGQALLNNFLIALTLFIGIGISILFLHTQTLQAVLLGISAGAFFHIFIHDLLPGHFHLRGKNLWQHIGMGAIGISVIVLIHLLVPHV